MSVYGLFAEESDGLGHLRHCFLIVEEFILKFIAMQTS